MATDKSLRNLLASTRLSRRNFIGQTSLAGLALLSATATAGAKSTAPQSQLTISRNEEMSNPDPQNNIDIINRQLERHIYDKLVEVDATGKFVPSLALSWTMSKDMLAWTFKLKKGVKFHNGEDFTSRAVKVTVERLKDPKLARATDWGGVLDGVDTPDEYTAVIKTTQPLGTMLVALAWTSIIPPKAFAEKGVALFDHPIGTGPYKFVEWIRNEHFVMERWPECWDKSAKIDRIVYRPIIEDATRIAALRSGEVDIIQTVGADQVPTLKGNGFQINRILAWDSMYLGLKCDQPPFDKKLCRQAINFAVDRESIVKKILLGGQPSVAMVPRGMLGFDEALKPFPHDPEKVKGLLKQGGYNGEKIRVIVPNAWYPKVAEVGQALAAQLMAVGLDIDLQVIEGAAFTNARRAGDYNIYMVGAANIDPSTFLIQRVVQDIFKSGYKNAEMFKAIEDASRTTDQAARAKLYQRAQQIMYDEAAPHIWLYQMEQIDALKKEHQRL